MRPEVTTRAVLEDAERDEVLDLVARAAAADGTAPLSEQFVLAVRGRPGHDPRHLLAYAGPDLAGYAQVADGAAEIVVDQAFRRQGIGSALLAALPDDVRVWAHGDASPAKAFAAAQGLEPVRTLWKLGRRFDGSPALGDVVLPAGLVARAFRPGQDETEWLRVNAAAFAHHPEQGQMTRADLEARMAEPWFDPEGFLLVVPEADPERIAAFHWTKVAEPGVGRAPGSDAASRGGTGEVYVLGIDPEYQGKGLAGPVTLLGLRHLRDAGVEDVVLYVDDDNPAAVRVYRKLGFETRSVDRMYARAR